MQSNLMDFGSIGALIRRDKMYNIDSKDRLKSLKYNIVKLFLSAAMNDAEKDNASKREKEADMCVRSHALSMGILEDLMKRVDKLERQTNNESFSSDN